jgi:CxxC motif-containing protein (DUF1111 family)
MQKFFFTLNKRYFKLLIAVAIFVGIALPLQAAMDSHNPDLLTGGQTSIANRTSRAFDNGAANLTAEEHDRHSEANATFNHIFVAAPAETNPGLGPLFNNSSCNGCHLFNGRGMPVIGNETSLKSQMLVRVSLPKGQPDAPGGAVPVPGIGEQIRDHAVFGAVPDAQVAVQWQEITGNYADGTEYKLRSPQTSITLPDGKSLPPEVMTSLRQSPPVIGLGLLEALDESTVMALADPDDRNGDGISGKPNRVWDVQKKATALGRFGLKANQPNLRQQSAAAYFNDMGISNPVFPDPDGSTDIDDKELISATFYTQSLTVPARSVVALQDPEVIKGDRLFQGANCAACHIQTLKTGNHELVALANQTIHPYTDVLLHNMGAGLADHRPDFEATGNEWRTAPLWGVGLTHTVLADAGFLHDARARTMEEAILWHGGEAEKSKEAFRNMNSSDRRALLKFLNSL